MRRLDLKCRSNAYPFLLVKSFLQKPASDKKETEESEDNLTPNQYTEIRNKKLEDMRTRGENPYPHKYHVTTGMQEFIDKYDNIKDGEKYENDGIISVAGRIHSYRASGTKLIFYDLRGEGIHSFF